MQVDAPVGEEPGSPADAEQAGVSPRRRGLQALVLAIPVVWIVWLGWTHRWMTEDGFIYLRIVSQVNEGNGPVFNSGERVEAFTGTLWVALLSLADLVTPIRLEWLSVLIGLACTASGVALALAGSRRLWSGRSTDAFFVPLGAVVFVALYPVWAYATSGLETGLVFAWLGACLWILAGWARRPDSRMSIPRAVVIGLGWLIRPEMVLFSAAFVVVVVVLVGRSGADGWRERARFVAAAVAVPVAYQVFRMGFYGSLVANTAIAKEGSATAVDRGWRYFTDFVGPYWLWVPVLGLVAGGYVPLASALARVRGSRGLAVVVAFVSCGILNALYVIAVGGDYHHSRMFLPALFAVCAPVAAVPATRQHLAGLVVAGWAVVAVLTLRPDQLEGDNWLANGFLAPREFGSVTAEDAGWVYGGPRMAWYTGPDFYYEAGLLQHRPADFELSEDVEVPAAALWAIGISGYALGPDVDVLDMMGLADSFTAHLESTPPIDPTLPRFPGHEKPLPSPWLAARVTAPDARPLPEQLPVLANPLIPPTSGAEYQEQVAWARAALRCEAIEDLLRSATAPLSFGRFVDNVAGSVANTRLRIPPDPETAYHRFCGPDTPPEVLEVRSGAAPTGDGG